MTEGRSAQSTYLLIPILLLSILLGVAVVRGPAIVTLEGLGSAITVAAPLCLATYALMSVAIAGRGTVDLAVGPLLAFINVIVVSMNELDLVTSPLGVFVLALGIGIAYQVLFALVIIIVRVQPIIVALSGFLALSGINRVIMQRPGGTAPEWMSSWGRGDTIFLPILLLIVLATVGWLLFTLSPFYKHLRMMGYDERAAFTSGVRGNLVRVGAHVIAGIFVALAAICYTALIASGDPTQGTTISLTAVTAVVLGGISLAGGRGNVLGALLGAINLFLIGYVLATFNFGSVQAFVTQMSYGLILIASLLLTLLVPLVGRHISFITPFSAFMILGSVVIAIMLTVGISMPEGALPVVTSGYDLLPATGTSDVVGLELTPIQKVILVALAVFTLGTIMMRIVVVEASARRFGVFGHTMIAGMLVLGLLVVALYSLPSSGGLLK